MGSAPRVISAENDTDRFVASVLGIFPLNNTKELAEYMYFTGPGPVAGQIIIIVVIILLAVFGNTVMCYAVYRTPNLRTVTNIFTINLGVTDLLVAMLVLPMWILSTSMGAAATRTPFADPLCKCTAFLTVLLLLVSIGTLAGISLDRYFSICHPLRYPCEVTQKRVYFCVGYIWMQSILLASAPLFGWGEYKFRPQSIPICNPAWSKHVSYAAFLIVLAMVIPLVIMLFSYIRIVQEARKQARRIEQLQLQLVNPIAFSNDDEEEEQVGAEAGYTGKFGFFRKRPNKPKSGTTNYSAVAKNLKTLKTVFIVVGAFFVCWGPYVLLNFWSVNNDHLTVPYMGDLLSTILAFSNSAVNPFVFMLLNRDFRFALWVMYTRCKTFIACRTAIKDIKRGKREVSQIETIRLHSRLSCDSGVDTDSLQNVKHVTMKIKLIQTYDNQSFVPDSKNVEKVEMANLRLKADQMPHLDTHMISAEPLENEETKGHAYSEHSELSPEQLSRRYVEFVNQDILITIPGQPTQ